ncbi:SDR family NAD(P)-dependent oxidoreductase [Nocardioides panzhihuensis]|uniref:NAD(P)-dependent dehydrogenase (Short-subunit alcohol dehydrogenase family) n=1 Tax=Nocardioides panzhihuensis TaxID=860243 RepID=A0A7Z0IQJ9_9ACTN|nr:SDR family NAD(P)-dependent oxidoreductase [Nocardioides panzhihuensis]NYI75843.1 NAD(P)-dependent dehydrogenase (short-subunit alcohol dehydrogenase family) [Nocardioides panzhihuensis]
MQIDNVAAIVTGAASGLGNATAAALAAKGARVFGLDLDIATAPEIDGVAYIKADVTSESQVRAAVAHAAEQRPLRVVINCAGIGTPARILGKAGVHDLALYAKIVQVNLIGTFTVLAIAAEAMASTKPLDHAQRGVIVNTASVAAFEGQIGQAAYSSAKGGVVGLTLPAARDLAQHGIRVNTIAPGIVETPMLASLSEKVRESLAADVPFPKRLGRPSDYADLVAFIIDHDYLNGEIIRMDGALRLAPR